MNDLETQLLELIKFVIGGVISVVGIYITIYIDKAIAIAKAKSESIKDERAKALLERTLNEIDDLIKTNIISVENTMKQSILKAIEDGKVDKSELNYLSNIVKENVLNQLGSQAIKIFNDNLNDTESYLKNRIEKILAELKSAEGTEVTKTVISEKMSTDISTSINSDSEPSDEATK